MAIHVKYFASLRDVVGRRDDLLETDEKLTVAEVWTRLVPNQPIPSNILFAVNMEYTESSHIVQDGDEVAFFPPVTGG